jgi:hypothetical protein
MQLIPDKAVRAGDEDLHFGSPAFRSNKPQPGEPLMSGVSFYDVTDPRNPKLLGEWRNAAGLTHGMEMDDSYVYVCGTSAESKKDTQVEELNILNYDKPAPSERISLLINRPGRSARNGARRSNSWGLVPTRRPRAPFPTIDQQTPVEPNAACLRV